MPQKKQTQYDPEENLRTFILRILEESGLKELTEEQKEEFLPKLVARAEYKIGQALIPKLSEGAAEEFTELQEQEETDPQVWKDFWEENVEDYDQVVTEALDDFAEECKEVLSKYE
ncbi:MAG: DUF5663 domain-containing protein [Candidatus Paceibacteria bacterium]